MLWFPESFSSLSITYLFWLLPVDERLTLDDVLSFRSAPPARRLPRTLELSAVRSTAFCLFCAGTGWLF